MHPALVTALERIAAREGRDPTALPPLYEAVDPDAVTAVLESNPGVTVRFAYAGYRVVIGPGPDEIGVIDAGE
ncbi:HalOD1 output domain-containing protein [Halopiger djelfimassiliensis]|uniref:HalOD1 output domain-containing protein n=1 Tax=Halopiger djelfimassiliensis TaxID=1293047 RepID=UPI000677B8AF|nr:HalOD1 output domain-containing protein [Halopiger djelfimassiliensis]